MNKHEKLIREIAEEMVLELHPYHKEGNMLICNDIDAMFMRREFEQLVNFMLPAARIAVKHMADAVDKALRYAEWRKYDERQAYLCFQGLIQEDSKGGMDETSYLMSSENNAARLTESLNRINNKSGKEAAGDAKN